MDGQRMSIEFECCTESLDITATAARSEHGRILAVGGAAADPHSCRRRLRSCCCCVPCKARSRGEARLGVEQKTAVLINGRR